MTTPAQILFVDDDRAMCETVREALDGAHYRVVIRTDPTEALGALADDKYDVVVTDLRMPKLDGLALCDRIHQNRPGVPVIVMTAFGNLDAAVGAIRSGAYDFLAKPFDIEVLRLAIDRAVSHRRMAEEIKRLRESPHTLAPGLLQGESRAMRALRDLVSRCSESEVPILIVGESGSGKERVARAIHEESRRSEGPFVACNCAAVPESLLESELFGHVKGAFTGAHASRTGLFLKATGGTLFLDEVGDLPLAMQPKLLRALQERKVRPVGSDDETGCDARVITATNQDLESAVDNKRFRSDLFFRLNVVQIPVPPLRERGNDVLLLANHFLQEVTDATGKPIAGFSAAAMEKLAAYEWPGNVRELQNCVERAVALTRFEEIAVEDLPDRVRRYRPTHLVLDTGSTDTLPSLEEVERRYILRVLEATGGQKTHAAKILGLDRKTLYRKLQKYQDD